MNGKEGWNKPHKSKNVALHNTLYYLQWDLVN